MENISIQRKKIATLRSAAEKSADDFYSALQNWSLSQSRTIEGIKAPTTAELQALKEKKNQSLNALNESLSAFNQTFSQQSAIEQISGELPIVLFPVRIECRYVNIKHVVRNVKLEDTVDVSQVEILNNKLKTTGFVKNDQGRFVYSIPSLHRNVQGNPGRLNPLALKPAGGKFIRRINDIPELRLRFYPDEISIENREKNLQPGEWQSGEQFWTNICGGKDPQEEWIRFSLTMQVPRAAWIIKCTQPTNFKPGIPLPETPVFPAEKNFRDGAYTTAPLASLLPDRFVVRLYKNNVFKEFAGNPISEILATGIDPTEDPFEQDENSGMQLNGKSVRTPNYLKWIHDFDEAVKKGMAISVNLLEHPEYSTGVEKIIVTGVKLSTDEAESSRLLESLFENHKYQESGMKIIPKGTPTNTVSKNITEQKMKEDEATLYFNADFKKQPLSKLATDESRIKTALGIGKLFSFPNGTMTELSEAALFNRNLWPATWGYYLLQLFTPAMREDDRESLKNFFSEFVSGRGNLPVLKINRQPYGFIPVSSLKDWSYSATPATIDEKIRERLWNSILKQLLPFWKNLGSKNENLNNFEETGINDAFVKMIGTNPVSSKMQRSWIAGTQFNSVLSQARRSGSATPIIDDPDFQPALVERALQAIGFNFANFTVSTRNYQAGPDKQLQHPVADDKGIEGFRLEKIPGTNLNYLEWLATAKIMDVWMNNYNASPPQEVPYNPSLFEQLCRQAFLRTALETGLKLAETNSGLWLLKVKDFEALYLQNTKLEFDPATINQGNLFLANLKGITDKYQLTGTISIESDKRNYLLSSFPFTEGLSLADWMDKNKKDKSTGAFRDMVEAMDYLSKIPVTALDKLFGEHLDLCSYRLDAWITGLFQQRLSANRTKRAAGIQLGAYGYLLGLKPSAVRATVIRETEPDYLPISAENAGIATIPVVLPAQAKANGIAMTDPVLKNCFLYLGEKNSEEITLDGFTGMPEPLQNINPSGTDGFIHAPSLALAATAAVMRNGYIQHVNDDKSSLLSVTLNPERVSIAMLLLQGMQQGIPLGILMGFYCERLLHDNNLDHLLLDLRVQFPVHIRENAPGGSSPMTTIDGMDLLNAKNKNPQGWLNNFPKILPSKTALEKVITTLNSYLDALNDLLLTESVYQAVKGNKARMAAPLRTMNSAGLASFPEFNKIPQKGRTIIHRIAIVFNQTNAVNAWKNKGSTRAIFNPGLNQWLGEHLPAPESIVVVVIAGTKKLKITLAEININPTDLLLIYPESFRGNNSSTIDLLIQLAVIKNNTLTLPAQPEEFTIDYKDRSLLNNNELTVFECAGLLRSMKKLISESRPLVPEDLTAPSQKSEYKTIKPDKLLASFKTVTADTGSFALQIKTLAASAKALETAINTNKSGAALETPVKNLLASLCTSWQPHLTGFTKQGLFFTGTDAINELATTARRMQAQLELNLATAKQFLAEIKADSTVTPIMEKLNKVSALLLGNAIPLCPELIPDNFAELQNAFAKKQLIRNTTPTQVNQWIREAAMVRKAVFGYRSALNFATILNTAVAADTMSVLQLPFLAQEQDWIGGKISATDKIAADRNLSLLLETKTNFAPQKAFSGLFIDEWPEWIPEKTVDTGISFQYNQPGTEPPQAVLMAVSPKPDGNWTWDFLTTAVEDTLELGKMRLVQPEKTESANPGLKHLLPAVILPFAENNLQTVVSKKI